MDRSGIEGDLYIGSPPTFTGRLRRAVEEVMRAERAGGWRRLLGSFLLAASWGFGLAVRLRSLLYEWRILSSTRLPCRVVSVGNLTVGGAGKTPTVIHLAGRCRAMGLRPVVLSRGYRGTGEKAGTVVSDGKRMLATEAEVGDEPYMIARSIPEVPVVVGSDRVRMGELACRRFEPDVVLLDDGFQHRKLCRDLDILLVDAREGFGNGCLLPRGTLREPPRALSRADLVILTKVDDRGRLRDLENEIKEINPGAEVLHGAYRPIGLADLATGESRGLEDLGGRSVIAASGIVNHDYFEYLLSMSGADVTGSLRYPDHHAYTDADLRRLAALAGPERWLITTEKDAARMEEGPWRAGEVFALRIAMEIEEADRLGEILTSAAGEEGVGR